MSKITVLLALCTACMIHTASCMAQDTKRPLDGKKILMVIASEKFQDKELSEPKALFEGQGATVTVASSTTEICVGMLGARVKPSVLLGKVKAGDYHAVVLVGGEGSKEYWENSTAHALVKTAARQDKVVAAICLAPVTLAKAGLLRGKRATVWKSESNRIKTGGAQYVPSAVQTDGKIITADGPLSARQFAEAISAALR